MKILLIANYAPDAQQSMLRFGDMLARGLAGRGIETETVRPPVRWRRWFPRAPAAAAKWLGYLDKYVVFPRELRRATAEAGLVHIVDHSNAVYVPSGPTRAPWVVTCHDLLAVRGARGEDTDCPASRLGRRLQRRILAGLGRAQAVACDSTSTLADLERLAPDRRGQLRRLILLGQNGVWRTLAAGEADRQLAGRPGIPWHEPFLLHVGSGLRRKNRGALVRVLARLGTRWTGNVIFAGEAPDGELEAEARACGVTHRVFGLESPDHPTLEAAYNRAHALLFPSKCEGFGWPVIEAQACGCPVICSDRTSLPEIAGAGALVCGLEDEAAMAGAVLALQDAAWRAEIVRRGRANLARFDTGRMCDDYEQLYAAAIAQSGRGGRPSR